jgi:FtsP/CotA-like multicopper oxidase with cupredoxin domain
MNPDIQTPDAPDGETEGVPAAPGSAWRTRVALGAALGAVGSLWMAALNSRLEIPGAAHTPILTDWLRSAFFILPLAMIAALIAGAVALRVTGRGRLASLRAGLAVATAAAVSLVLGAGSVVHDWMFGTVGRYDAAELSPLTHIGRDSLFALAVLLPLASLLVLAIGRARPTVPGWAVPSLRGVAFTGVAAAFGAALILAPSNVNPLSLASAADTTGNPCPAGSPLKHFDVSAIDMNIPLNRFGDHDPKGHMYVLNGDIPAARAEEQSQQVSVGLHDNDAIQPLTIRANMGDCVEIGFTNRLGSNQPVGLHIDGLAYKVDSSGDAVGNNPSSNTDPGQTRTYMYYVPKIESLEGARYMHPGPGNRALVNHGLFGTLVVEPEGSTYLNAKTRQPLTSGWEAIIVPAHNKSFREAVTILHEIGNEQERVLDKTGHELPFIDPHTTAYRPGTRAINYRSEPFLNRVNRADKQKSLGYSSYTFADPATTIPRGYLGDPTKIRLLHAGSEVFHIYHLHGGGIRWRLNPHGDPSYNYADTGLNKNPAVVHSNSNRLDAMSVGPGESYDLEIEGGAGGVQQAAGDFVWHCHIGEHYVAGMWSLWRVYDTLQPDLAPLPDRAEPPMAVDSRGLIGRTFNGQTITEQNLDQWIRPQLPAQGVSNSDQDAQVLDWTVQQTPKGPLYLNEPEDTSAPWADNFNENPAHPSALRNDVFQGNRPELQFNPINGRPAWPLLRPHIGKRPPFSPNGHSGAPWLGETQEKTPAGAIDPWANRPDGLCPNTAPVRKFNIVGIETPIQVTKTKVDPIGRIFVLAKEKQAVLDGTKPKEPLAIRMNIGDCAAVTLTSEMNDNSITNFDKINLHIHHVQFDPQASDGVITGYSYEQSIRPYKLEDPQLVDPANTGDTTLHLASVAKFHNGASIAVGLG